MKTQTIKTRNNNYLVKLPDNHYNDYAYFDNNFNFLRLASGEEGDWLFDLAKMPKREWVEGHFRPIRSRARRTMFTLVRWKPAKWKKNHDLEIVNINIPKKNIPGVYIIPESDYEIFTETIEEDFSNFSPEKGSNGGEYGFWTEQITIHYNGKIYTYEEKRTTSEFAYDGIDGHFDQKATSTDVAIQEGNKILIFDGIDILSTMDIFILIEEDILV